MRLAEDLGICLEARGELIEYAQVREWADPTEEELTTLIERINSEWIKPYGLTEDDLVHASGLKRPYVCYLLSDLARPPSPSLGGSTAQGRVEVYSVLLEMLRRFDEGLLKEADFLRIKADPAPEAAFLVKAAPATTPLSPQLPLDSARESLGVSAIVPPATVPLGVDLTKMADHQGFETADTVAYTPSHHDPTVIIDASPSAATAIAEKDSQRGDFDGDENSTDGGLSPPQRAGPPATSPIYNSQLLLSSAVAGGNRGPATMPLPMTMAPPTFPMPPPQASFYPVANQQHTDTADTSPFILPPVTAGVGIGANGSIIPGPHSVPLPQAVPLPLPQSEMRAPPSTTPLIYTPPQILAADAGSSSSATPVRSPPSSIPLTMTAPPPPMWSSVPIMHSAPPQSTPIRPMGGALLSTAPQSVPLLPSAPLSLHPTTIVEPPTVHLSPASMSLPTMGQLPYPALSHTMVAPPSVPLTAMSPSLVGGPLLPPRPMSTPIMDNRHNHNVPLSALAAHLYGNQTGPPRPMGLAPVVEPAVEEGSDSEENTQSSQPDELRQEGDSAESSSQRRPGDENEGQEEESQGGSESEGSGEGQGESEAAGLEETADDLHRSGGSLNEQQMSQDRFEGSGEDYARRKQSSRYGTEQSSTMYHQSDHIQTVAPHLESTPLSSPGGPHHHYMVGGGMVGSLPLSQLEINYRPNNELSTPGRLPMGNTCHNLSVANSFVTEVTPEATHHPEDDSESECSRDGGTPLQEQFGSNQAPSGSLKPLSIPSSEQQQQQQLPTPQWNGSGAGAAAEVVVSLDTPHTIGGGHYPHNSGGSVPSDLVSGLLPGFERHTEEDEESAAELVRACLYNTESQRRRTEQAAQGAATTTGPRGRAALQRFLEDKFINKAVRGQLEKASGLILKRQHRRLQKAKERGDTSQEVERTIDLLVVHMEITSRSVPGDIKTTDASPVASLLKEVHLLIVQPRRECSAEAECLAWTLLVEALRHP